MQNIHLMHLIRFVHSLLPAPLSDETLLTNVACGVLSGVISSSIANPTDVLKVGICYMTVLFGLVIMKPFM